MADVNVNRLVGLGMSPELSVEVRKQIDAGGGSGGSVSSDDVTVPEITEANFTFAGGSLTEFAQAIADAIPAS